MLLDHARNAIRLAWHVNTMMLIDAQVVKEDLLSNMGSVYNKIAKVDV